ncbi:hypothetical protein ABZ511_26410 [Nocardia gamkensis]|uniref:hypothetical protein n=1 Tax=Nocardia gamkensis TaxID=352869 RepID=UPI0033C64F9A
MNRFRHFATVIGVTPTAAATCAFAAPRTNSYRCASVTTNSGPDLGRPVLTTAESYD